MKYLLGIFITFFAFCTLSVKGQNSNKPDTIIVSENQDSLIVSLLTCSPGSLVYELYGHTAIRVRETRRSNDWVFNYGSFSFDQPHFMWRFVLGKTDYELAVTPYFLFYNTYLNEGREIIEQPLNLTTDEARRLVDALSENLLPQNSTYRYNFFYDNCTTRAIQMIEKAVNGKVVWTESGEVKTLRDIVHEFSAKSPWNEFGQDILLGAEADEIANVNKQMFAPIYAANYMKTAKIILLDGTERPLIKTTHSLLPSQTSYNKRSILNPLFVFGTLLVVILAISYYEYKSPKYYWGLDALLLTLQGLTGCIISFLFFFSEHPAVGSNWLISVFNPLPLLILPWFMKNASLRKRAVIMYVQPLLLAIALLSGILNLQSYPIELYFILGILATRVYIHYRKTLPSISKE